MMQWSNVTKRGFIFQHSLPCRPHTSSISVAALGFLWYRTGLLNWWRTEPLWVACGRANVGGGGNGWLLSYLAAIVARICEEKPILSFTIILLPQRASRGAAPRPQRLQNCRALPLYRCSHRSSHPDPQKSPQLQIWPHHHSNTASQLSVFFMFGNTKLSDGAKSGECGGWSTISKPQSRTAAIATKDLCAAALSRWNRTPFVSFPGHLRNVPNITFQSCELLIQCGFLWMETMQLVLSKVEFNTCQVSLLWHNSFLVGLWTFQPMSYGLFLRPYMLVT